MKWKKLGKIFDPTNHVLSFDCTEYAQSPQALIFDDFVRIYFSTRKREEGNMFKSHIVYVDFKKDFSSIINYSQNEIIPLGSLGCFDEHGIFPFNPLKYKNRILAYTCGWSRRISVPVETSTGFAESYDNGETFNKLGNGPILTSSLYEPMLVGDSFVKYFEDRFHMWYIFGPRWYYASTPESPARVYKIGHAISDDGVNWKKEDGIRIVQDVLDDNECQALPTVEKWGDRYHMYFCYRFATDFRNNKSRSYRLGYAYSYNLKEWIRDDENSGISFSQSGWDDSMMCYPNVFECDNKLYLLYNGNEFGKFGFGLAELQSM